MSSCDMCIFWDGKEFAGKCRRYPPIVIPDEEKPLSEFPTTFCTDRCGEFKRGVLSE